MHRAEPATQARHPTSALMRCYFHLIKGDETITDDTGIEVLDLEQARAAFIKAVAELRVDNPSLAEEGAGWTLVAVDASEAVLFEVPLDGGLVS